MTQLEGMIVKMVTKDERYSGTDDPMYIGYFGTGGGKEVNLDVRRHNDFRRGRDESYHLGTVWEGAATDGTMKPRDSTPGHENDPGDHNTVLEDIQYVYLRKAGSKSERGDDKFQLESVTVTLYGTEGIKRTFRQSSDLWLGNEFGQICYLVEQ